MKYVFIDTEFTDFAYPQLISIGLVTEDGQHEFYRENSDHNPNMRSMFVNQVVIPLLERGDYMMTHQEIATQLCDWFNSFNTDIRLVIDYQGDWALLYELLQKAPPRIKIQPMFFTEAYKQMCIERGYHRIEDAATGVAKYCDVQDAYFEQDPRQHHALVDAKAMRHAWAISYQHIKDNVQA